MKWWVNQGDVPVTPTFFVRLVMFAGWSGGWVVGSDIGVSNCTFGENALSIRCVRRVRKRKVAGCPVIKAYNFNLNLHQPLINTRH